MTIRSNHVGYVHDAARCALTGLISGMCEEDVTKITETEIKIVVEKAYQIGLAFCEKGTQITTDIYAAEGKSPFGARPAPPPRPSDPFEGEPPF